MCGIGQCGKILDDADKGDEARKLYADAQAMLDKVVADKWLRAAAVVGLFPANAAGDDIEIYTDDTRGAVRLILHNLRKQGRQPAGKYNECLSDYIAPLSSGRQDYIGGFACTAGLGIDAKLSQFEAEHDDYRAIMLKALADPIRLRQVVLNLLSNAIKYNRPGGRVIQSTIPPGTRKLFPHSSKNSKQANS